MLPFNSKIPSLNDKLLYHFTSALSLIKILESRTVKFSKFDNLNDLNEKEIKFLVEDWSDGNKIQKYIVNNCKLISFSRNFENEIGRVEYGINHPRMWAQYAENNKGACIVINEDKFKERNRDCLDKVFWILENVEYSDFILYDEPNELIVPERFVKDNYKSIFFHKHTDWRKEDERRLLCIGGPEFLSLNSCIESVCLGSRFENENYEKLIDIIISSIISGSEPLLPHQFTFQFNAEGRSLPFDNANRIIEYMFKKKERTINYFSYLNESGYNIGIMRNT